MSQEGYNRNIAVKAMVLREIKNAGGPILGSALRERVEDACRSAVARVSDFDFVGWVGCTIWELLSAFSRKGYIALDDEELPSPAYLLMRSSIRITEAGVQFFEAARAEALQQFAHFD